MEESKKRSGSGSEPNMADRVLKQVVDCDPSVLSLIVLDGDGRVLSTGRSSRLQKEEYADQATAEKLGAIASVIMGSASNAKELLGGIEFLIGAFKKQKVLLVNLQQYSLLLALRMTRSANAEYVYRKISDILASN